MDVMVKSSGVSTVNIKCELQSEQMIGVHIVPLGMGHISKVLCECIEDRLRSSIDTFTSIKEWD